MLNFVQRRHTRCRIRHHAITVHCIRSHNTLIRPRRLLNYRYMEKKNLNKNTHTQNPLEYHIWWPLKVQQCRWSSFSALHEILWIFNDNQKSFQKVLSDWLMSSALCDWSTAVQSLPFWALVGHSFCPDAFVDLCWASQAICFCRSFSRSLAASCKRKKFEILYSHNLFTSGRQIIFKIIPFL